MGIFPKSWTPSPRLGTPCLCRQCPKENFFLRRCSLLGNTLKCITNYSGIQVRVQYTLPHHISSSQCHCTWSCWLFFEIFWIYFGVIAMFGEGKHVVWWASCYRRASLTFLVLPCYWGEAFSLIFARFVEKIQDYTVLRIYFRNQDHNFGDIDWWSLCFFVSQAFLRCVWNLWPCFRYSRNNGWIWMQKVKLKLSCCL